MPTSTKRTAKRTTKSKRSTGSRYGNTADRKVGRAMHEMKRGELRSGRSGRKVTNPKQAVAIGLSEARQQGGKVPAARRRAPVLTEASMRTAKTGKTRTKRPQRTDDGNAFIPDPGEGPAHANDELAELLAEDYLAAATGGDDALDDDLEAVVSDEVGGAFVTTTAAEELADDVDESNPSDATREPRPLAVAGLARRPRDS